MKLRAILFALVGLSFFKISFAQYTNWKYSGSLFILTTPEGADLPAGSAETNFPLLIRLDKSAFPFSEAQPSGGDIRFTTATGTALSYQIESWDLVNGKASIWVRIPLITGNARQEIKMYWGNTAAVNESNGSVIFNSANNFLTVLHMSDELNPVKDESGALTPKNVGTTSSQGMIGKGRHFLPGKGIEGGVNTITNYPVGNAPHTTSFWCRSESLNKIIAGWAQHKGQSMVRFQFMSPGLFGIDGWFSNASLQSKNVLSYPSWHHIVYSYKSGDTRIYIDGKLDGTNSTPSSPLAITSPASLWIGGWTGTYEFEGDIDEFRIAGVARSANWAKLEFENQKPMQSLVGHIVQPGTTFSASQNQITLQEGKSIAITAMAGGAQKINWILIENGLKKIIATDQFTFVYQAPRIISDQSLTLQLQAVYPGEVKTLDIPVSIQECIPDPIFTLSSSSTWNGRDTISITTAISNLKELQDKGYGNFNYSWNTTGVAVDTSASAIALQLRRAQGNGLLNISLTLDNGGVPLTKSITLQIQQPITIDPWVEPLLVGNAKPVNNQFYARNDKNVCNVRFSDSLSIKPDSVFLIVSKEGGIFKNLSQTMLTGRYTFTIPLEPGLFKYRFEFFSKKSGVQTVVTPITNVVCGDAYVIEGQSNAYAYAYGDIDPKPDTNTWIRTYRNGWYTAVHRWADAGVGYWGLELARNLVQKYNIPICIINGSVGGTRIDQHQRNDANPTDGSTIYGSLLARVRDAKLTHGIRGVLWHQGEADQGLDTPTGKIAWETYQSFFNAMSADWKSDFPNIRFYYIFQIWPDACGGKMNGSDDMLREMQRQLPSFYSNLSIMSTLGIKPGSSCHYLPEGYQKFADLIGPLVERDNYGAIPTKSITPPNLQKVWFASKAKTEIALQFDQPILWVDSIKSNFFLDRILANKIVSGKVNANRLTLNLNAATSAKTITYLKGETWNMNQGRLIYGTNELAALTFSEVAIQEDSASGTGFIFKSSNAKISKNILKSIGHTNDQYWIEYLSASGSQLIIKVLNIGGQTLTRKEIISSGSGKISIGELKQGIYFISAQENGRDDVIKKIPVF